MCIYNTHLHRIPQTPDLVYENVMQSSVTWNVILKTPTTDALAG